MAMKGTDIRRLREQLNLSQEDVAKEVGTSQQSIQRIETGETKTSQYTGRIVDFLNRVSMAASSNVPPTSSSALQKNKQDFIRGFAKPESYPSSVSFKIPIIAIDYAEMELYSFDTNLPPIDYINRPHPLTFSPRGYGIYIIASDMAPELKPGETALINPDIPPLPGEIHALSTDVHSDGRKFFMFGLLISQNAESWTIERGGKRLPAISKAQFPHCERIVGKFARR